MFRFSIIVPIYNTEKYLSKCINSILVQSFKYYELILVNDGSTDKSGLICDKYSAEHGNISVIHKKNGGVSDARNIGISQAEGEYIIFVDSDDYIERDALNEFNNELIKSNNPDLLITRIKKFYKDLDFKYMDKNLPVERIKNGNKTDILSWIFNKSDNIWPSVRYVIKHDLIKKYNLKFPFDYLHEDIDWSSQIFLHASTFSCSGYYWYNHRLGREKSISTYKNSKRTLDVIEIVAKNINDNKYNEIEASSRNIIFKRLVNTLFYSLSDYGYYNKTEKKLS